ncbi:YusW family protein [Halobacillus litoralis]|uniref:YusW family protein n=1 Tax=Halobacillus litoralis TaxID=45668 RepID=UPI001CFE3E9D|nr:YusW family protein [Halobacillus litoralis]
MFKYFYGSLVILFLIVLSACGGKAQDEAINQPQPANFENVTYDTAKKTSKAFNFTTFELEVDYADTLSYKVDYVYNKEQTKAVIHEIGEESISGEKAMNQLTPLLRELSFDESSTENEVIHDVFNVFGLDETFKEFNLRVVFQSGEQKEYRR